MLFPIPIFIPQFPYVQIKEVSIFEGRTVYEKHSMGTDGEITGDWQKDLINKNRQLLLDNQVPINKIRFVFTPIFTYDIDNNIINPKYDVMLPINGSNGLFAKNAPLIELNKPKNLISVTVHNYKVEDNYEFIKLMAKKTKRGLVYFVVDEMVDDFFKKEKKHYYSGVDAEIIRLINLDDAIEYYKFDTVDENEL